MTSPSWQEIQVATQALRDEGKIWLTESPMCGDLAFKVEGLSRTRLQAGIFQAYIGSYQHLCETMSTVLNQAEKAMDNIGSTLYASADTYEQEEQNNVHLAQQKW